MLTRQLDKMKEPGHLVIDNTGIKVFGESEWLETKHGKQYKGKVWRKLHLENLQNSGVFSYQCIL